MKRLKLASLFLMVIFSTSCSFGKKYLLPKGSDSLAAGQTSIQKEIQPKPLEGAESYLQAGIEKLHNQDHEAAIQEFKKALILDPHRAEAYYYLALAEQKSGRLDDAAEGYRAAIKADPQLYEAIFNLAAIYSLQGKYDLALDRYYEGLNLMPDDPELHYNMGLCLEHMGKREKAIPEYQKAYQLDPGMVDAYLQLAGLYERQGMLSEAREEYQKVLKIAPGNEVAQKNLALLSTKAGGEKAAQAESPLPAAGESAKEGVFSRLMSYPKKLYRSTIRGGKEEEENLKLPKEEDFSSKRFHLNVHNKLVIQKKVVFTNGIGDNTIKSKRTIAQLGYASELFKNTRLYLNLGSVSMGFDQTLNLSPQVKFEKAVAFAYGVGICSDVYSIPESPLGIKLNLDLVRYSPKGNEDGGSGISATAKVVEYEVAADTIYQGFSKFSPYLGLLYAKSSGSLDLSNLSANINFDEKDQFGCRLGTDYCWRENINLSAEYRMLDESALSLSIHYAF
ncbi:MAG: tetratricopeptide repeat protein [bacterium]|nr:tetratricopeptide repeat protein [bacterium]